MLTILFDQYADPLPVAEPQSGAPKRGMLMRQQEDEEAVLLVVTAFMEVTRDGHID